MLANRRIGAIIGDIHSTMESPGCTRGKRRTNATNLGQRMDADATFKQWLGLLVNDPSFLLAVRRNARTALVARGFVDPDDEQVARLAEAAGVQPPDESADHCQPLDIRVKRYTDDLGPLTP